MKALKAEWRFAHWALDIDSSASGSSYQHQCATCGDQSGVADTAEGPDMWCLRHAERTGHTDFRCVITTFFRASLSKGPR
ncbi:DUF7848 domain-containing protein [Streptomyces noursei]